LVLSGLSPRRSCHARWRNVQEVQQSRLQILITVLKASTNAWTIGKRAHEHIRLTCIFGCEFAPDELAHYIACPELCILLYRELGTPGATDPIRRLNLIPPLTPNVLKSFLQPLKRIAFAKLDSLSPSNTFVQQLAMWL
jgi:hypothetical protein